MAITTELEAMGTSLGDVVSFMEDIKSKETNVSQLREAIDINAQLERMGTSPSSSLAPSQGFLKPDLLRPRLATNITQFGTACIIPTVHAKKS